MKTKAERERIATEEQVARDQEAELEKERLAAAQKFQSTFGYANAQEFQSECRAAIMVASGSTDLGVFNTETFEYPQLGSLVLNQSVYFGKFEERYKCWNSKGQKEIKLEVIQ